MEKQYQTIQHEHTFQELQQIQVTTVRNVEKAIRQHGFELSIQHADPTIYFYKDNEYNYGLKRVDNQNDAQAYINDVLQTDDPFHLQKDDPKAKIFKNPVDRILYLDYLTQANQKLTHFIFQPLVGQSLAKLLAHVKYPFDHVWASKGGLPYLNYAFLNAINSQYLPVILSGQEDFVFHYLPKILQQKVTPMDEHQNFVQLVFFDRASLKTEQPKYYYTLPIQFNFSDTNKFKSEELPLIEVPYTTIQKLNQNAVHYTSYELIPNHKVQILPTSIYLNPQTLIPAAMTDLLNKRQIETYFAKNTYSEPQRNYYQSVDKNLENMVEHYLQTNLSMSLNDSQIKASFKIASDYWQQALKTLPTKYNYFEFVELMTSQKISEMHPSEQIVIKNHLRMSSYTDDQPFSFIYTEDPDEMYNYYISAPTDFIQNLKQKINTEFCNVDLNKATQIKIPLNPHPQNTFQPISRPQHNLSQLMASLIPNSDQHQMYLVDQTHLINLAGSGQIKTLQEKNLWGGKHVKTRKFTRFKSSL